ncbi:hypothetical protein BEH_25170 (plasmid) [Priestia filamentosa]|uniref:Uncharacterized protein n=1 Tax=Priestia filamentosa TaxID=1402861 RepID=A0A2S1LZP0_9BACI|nr:hypothetical protein [Priestia filamentosa]AWG44279.1 hypothetical protein BEH_25170 [Priestia filamentosa]
MYEYDYDRKDYYDDKYDKHKKMKCYYEELGNHPEYNDYYGKYDRKHHDKHDKYRNIKCYWEEPENHHKYDDKYDKYDRKHHDKKDHDDYKDEKRKFVLEGYIYYKENCDCDCKKRYY